MKKILLVFTALVMCFQVSFAAFPTTDPTTPATTANDEAAQKQSFKNAVA